MTAAARFLVLLLVCLPAAVVPGPASARCAAPSTLSSVDPVSSERSFVYTPGVCFAAHRYPCELGPYHGSVTGSLKGSFWALGAGDTRPGYGIDNGTFGPGYPGPNYPGVFYGIGRSETWMRMPMYGAAVIDGSWSANEGIDGCPGDRTGPLCTAVLLSDTHHDEGYFALLTKRAVDGSYSFARSGGAPIRLAELPAPRITGVQSVDDFTVRITVAPPFHAEPGVSEGFHLDPDCGAGEQVGWKVLRRNVERRAGVPPTGRELADWEPLGDIRPLDGAAQTVEAGCTGEQDIYLAYSLQFDSGFELTYVSANSRRIECGPGARHGIHWAAVGKWLARVALLAAVLWAVVAWARRRPAASRARLRRAFFATVTLAGTLGVGLFIGELAFRRWGDPWPYREPGSVVGVRAHGVASDYLPGTTAPNVELRRRRIEFDVTYRTNNEGFRDDEPLLPEKPAGEYRVLLCGDSFTWGQGAAFEDTYGEVAEQRLNRDGAAGYRVLNAGYRSGYTVDHYFAFLERESERWSPDHLVVQIYTAYDLEDMEENLWEEVDERGFPRVIRSRRLWTDHQGRFVDQKHYDPYLPEWLRGSRLTIGVARAVTGRYAVRRPLDPALAEERMRTMIRAIHDHAERTGRPLTWIVVPSRMRGERHHRTKDVVGPVLVSLGDDVIDLEAEIETSGRPWDSLFYPRDGHLNAEGYRLLGELLAERIETSRVRRTVR